MDEFISWSQGAAMAIGKAANPTINIEQRATKGWALTELHEAVFIMLGYAVIVAIGMAIRPAAKDSTVTGNDSKRAKKAGPLSWTEVGEKFGAQPVTMTLSIVYNLVQVGLCVWMVVFTAQQSWKAGYPQHVAETGLFCVPHKLMPSADNYADHHKQLHLVLWVFYVSKILDFVDTMFIIVKGNWRQFSFLHVFHHFSIFAFYWLNTYAGYDGDIWWTIVANGSIHAMMYWYYALTTLGAQPAWKSLMTVAQLVQFVTMMTQAVAIMFNAEECGFPRPIASAYFFYIAFLFILFVQFFAATYCSARKPKTD